MKNLKLLPYKILFIEIIICSLPTVILSYFVINSFNYAKNHIFFFIILVTCALFFNVILSYITKKILFNSMSKIILNLKNNNQDQILKSIKDVLKSPYVHSILAFLEWTLCPVMIVFLPFIIKGWMTGIEFFHSIIFVSLTAFIIIPLYFMLNEIIFFDFFELEKIKNIDISNKIKKKFKLSYKIVISIFLSILYPTGNLAFLIYLDIFKYIKLKDVYIGIILLVAASLIISIIVGLFISIKINKNIKNIIKKLKKISDGNLEENFIINSNDEIGDLSHYLNIVINKLNNNVVSISNSGIKLAEWVDKVSSISSEISNGSEKQTNIIEKINSFINRYNEVLNIFKENIAVQNDNLDKMSENIIKLNNGINSILKNTQTVTNKVNENQDTINNSQEKLLQSIKSSLNMNESMKNIADNIINVGNETENIDIILKTIEDISEKTNLLAINTSIEAAHAGEAGKGFAIIANEIKKLAENSKKSVNEISTILLNIKTAVNDAINITKSGKDIAIHNKTLSEESGKSLEKVINNIKDISSMITGINNTTHEQQIASKSTLESANELKSSSSIIDNQMKDQLETLKTIIEAINEITKISEENKNQSNFFTELAVELINESVELNIIVSNFKLKK